MKKTILIALCVLSASAFAQKNEVIQIGPSLNSFTNSGAHTFGLGFAYKNSHGLYVPVDLDFGSGIKAYSAGIGYTSKNLKALIQNSVALSLANINFDPSYDLTTNSSISRLTALLQDEVSFQLSKSINLGVHLRLDLVNGIRRESKLLEFKSDHVVETPLGVSWLDSDTYTNMDEYHEAADKYDRELKKQSMTSVGLSLKINLFDKK